MSCAADTADDWKRVRSVAVHKKQLSKAQKVMRLCMSFLDPRMYLHGLRMLNYYNQSHVRPLRLVTKGRNLAISPDATFADPVRITLGDRVRIGSRCHIWAGPSTGRIIIGDDVLFGPDVMVTAATYRYNDGSPVTRQLMDEADIIIGRDVWIGVGAIILAGARIGDGAVIGAGSVVKGHIPPFALAVGSPAKVVGSRTQVFEPSDLPPEV